MDYLFEFILELILEGSIEASKNKKIPKPIRYFLGAIISLFFIGTIGLIFFVGIISIKDNLVAGILLIFIGLLMTIMSVIEFRKTFKTKTLS